MTDSKDHTNPRMVAVRARVFIVGAIVPVALSAIATILMFSWLPELPDPLAVHWSGAGADGFGPAVPFIVTPLIITVLFSIFAVAFSWKWHPSPHLVRGQKLLLVTSVWLASVLSGGIASSVAVQRGLSDAHDAPDQIWWLAISAAIGFVLAIGGWLVLPRSGSVDEPGDAPAPLTVRGEERVSWSRHARLGTAALVVVGSAMAIAIITMMFAMLTSPESMLLGVIVLVAVAVLSVALFWWRISADRRGLIARTAFGWPRKRIPLENIRSVKVVDIQPTRDFGGWGWRWTGDGRSGVILRAGPSIEVTQTNGKRFVVTVDDAKTGAGVLIALMRR